MHPTFKSKLNIHFFVLEWHFLPPLLESSSTTQWCSGWLALLGLKVGFYSERRPWLPTEAAVKKLTKTKKKLFPFCFANVDHDKEVWRGRNKNLHSNNVSHWFIGQKFNHCFERVSSFIVIRLIRQRCVIELTSSKPHSWKPYRIKRKFYFCVLFQICEAWFG